MLKNNIGIGDRFIRLLLALILLYLSFFVYSGSMFATSLIAIAAILTLSSIAGSCFLYSLFGIDTRSHDRP